VKYRRAKIIATLGPKCSDRKSVQTLADFGVNCFRINLSHGTIEEKKYYFDLVRSISISEKDRPSILADLAGPKIRISGLDGEMCLEVGDKIVLSNEKEGPDVIPVSSNVAFLGVNPGAKIMIDDGQITLEVINQISSRTLECRTETSGIIKKRKGVNFPGVALDVPCLTNQDLIDLELALSRGADWIALSFTRNAKDYIQVQSRMRDLGFQIPVMAKIEKWEAVENLDEIVDAFDAVMVARGDLGVELPVEQVPLIQKNVIEKASLAGKPVVIATQILESMTVNPVPTRAEVSDIANAILDGADALMVTGETAIGAFPQKVIQVLDRVIEETEDAINYDEYYNSRGQNLLSTAQAISHAACSVAHDLNINVLVTMTHSGSTARMVSRYRPAARIIAMTPFPEICRQLSIVWGITPFLVKNYKNADDITNEVGTALKNRELIIEGEKFVITGGVPIGSPGTTNYLSVLKP
tara:strand:+ start:15865 stop:17274 length:1410 start_codon:yes stop_codon:yes gene_type:complete